MWLEYYLLSVSGACNVPSNLFYQEQNDELYLSPNVKLCGPGAQGQFDSKNLAEEFRAAVIDILRKRYDDKFELTVTQFKCEDGKPELARIASDSDRARTRLIHNDFTPNAKF